MIDGRTACCETDNLQRMGVFTIMLRFPRSRGLFCRLTLYYSCMIRRISRQLEGEVCMESVGARKKTRTKSHLKTTVEDVSGTGNTWEDVPTRNRCERLYSLKKREAAQQSRVETNWSGTQGRTRQSGNARSIS